MPKTKTYRVLTVREYIVYVDATSIKEACDKVEAGEGDMEGQYEGEKVIRSQTTIVED